MHSTTVCKRERRGRVRAQAVCAWILLAALGFGGAFLQTAHAAAAPDVKVAAPAEDAKKGEAAKKATPPASAAEAARKNGEEAKSLIERRPTPRPVRPTAAKPTAAPPATAAKGAVPPPPVKAAAPKKVNAEELTELGKPMPKFPVDPHRPKTDIPASDVGVTEEGNLIDFDFENIDLMQAIKIIGARTQMNFDIDPALASQKVTVITHAPIPVDMAYEVLESILAMRGYEMTPVIGGHLVRIQQAGQSMEKKELFTGKEQMPEGYDTVSTHIVPVLYADVTELSQILQTLGSQAAAVHAYVKTNTLILTDTADGIRHMLEFLEEIDVPGYDTEMEILTLEYTRAEILSTQIQDVLLGTDGQAGGAASASSARRTPTRPVSTARPTRPTIPGRQASTVVGSYEETLRIVPDERLNALIVVASRPLMDRVRELVDLLDTPTQIETNNLHVYELLNADAEDVETALNAIIGTTPRAQGAQQGGQQATVEVQPFEKKVLITQYEQTNSILVVAAPQDYRVLKELIAQLDVPQRQVHVRAIIMEVVINDGFNLSVELAGLTGNDGFGLSNVVNLANVLASGAEGQAAQMLAFSQLGTDGGAVAGIIDGTTEVAIDDAGTTVEIANVPLLFQALESITELDVLSQPGLTTKDNVEASVIVGQEVPFITGSSRSLNQVASDSSNVFSRVDRKDVGIKLSATPQITEGNFVSMELEVEVSQPVQSSVGADPNIVGPTLQKSNVTTEVVIKDGATGIIGGLIRESTDRSIRQPPVFGDLPGLGWLFRRKDNDRAKRNLVVLVTPYIIKQGPDMERVTNSQVEQFEQANIDVLFEKGFIKKIQKRRYMRNKYRPSQEHTSRYKNRSNFGRGSMERDSQ